MSIPVATFKLLPSNGCGTVSLMYRRLTVVAVSLYFQPAGVKSVSLKRNCFFSYCQAKGRKTILMLPMYNGSCSSLTGFRKRNANSEMCLQFVNNVKLSTL
jgi:hypothetical protein